MTYLDRETLIDRETLEKMLPHGPGMIMLEKVVSYDEESIICSTLSHCSETNVLREDNRLSAVHLIEYAAQAMALHEAISNEKRVNGIYTPVNGVVSALKDINLLVEYMDDLKGELDILARKLISSGKGAIYSFEVSTHGVKIAFGRITVSR